MKKYTNNQINEFLIESNAIEGIYGSESLADAVRAWEYGFDFSKKNKKITRSLILDIHRLLLARLNPRIAGRLRACNVWIGGERKKFTGEAQLLDRLDQWIESSDLFFKNIKKYSKEERVVVIQNLHISFEDLHPFEDGNGRTGRLLMNLQRWMAGLPILIIHEGDEQMDYYQWFRDSDDIISILNKIVLGEIK